MQSQLLFGTQMKTALWFIIIYLCFSILVKYYFQVSFNGNFIDGQNNSNTVTVLF